MSNDPTPSTSADKPPFNGERMRLGDSIDYVRGVTYKANSDLSPTLTEGYITLLRANNIQNGKLILDDVQYVSRQKVKPNQILRKGDILVCASSGSKNLVGKAAQILYDMDATFGAFCCVIRPKTIDPKFLAHFFQSSIYRREIEEVCTGSNINNLKANNFKYLKINAHGAKTGTIVWQLDQLKACIDQCHTQLDLLQQLIKSRFIEMFGDPCNNPRNYAKMLLSDVAKGKLTYGANCASKEYDGNYRYIRITDITENGKLTNDIKSPVEVSPRYVLNDGDILFARTGATVGKTYLYKTSAGNAIYAGYLIRLVPNQEMIIPEYLYWVTKSSYYQTFVDETKRSVAQPNINAKEYGSLTIVVPPLSLQQEFADFVAQVDKSQFVAYRHVLLQCKEILMVSELRAL